MEEHGGVNDIKDTSYIQAATRVCSIITGLLFIITFLSTYALSSSITNADNNSAIDTISVTVNAACTLSSSLGTTTGVTGSTDGNGNNTYTTTINSGDTKEINGSVLSTVCNDSAGYSLYAIGYSGNSYDSATHTKMIGTNANIDTGTSGSNSYWAMKLQEVSGFTPPTITNNFDSYHVIPNTYTKIATYNAATASSTAVGATVQANYRINISASQVADTYIGKVKYTIVHPNNTPAPETPFGLCSSRLTCMQTVNNATLSSLMPNINDTTILYDSRDGQAYTIARLADDKYWMTMNLNIAGGTILSSEDTDMDSSWTLPISNGFQNNNKLPSSTTDFNDNATAYVYNTNNVGTCTSTGCYSYYSWVAATLGSGVRIYSDNTDAPYSICPKGWRLPTSRSTTTDNSDFYQLAVAYGMSNNVVSQYTNNFYNNAGDGATPNFLLVGAYDNGSFSGGETSGSYWSSSTSQYSSYARFLSFSKNSVNSSSDYYRRIGLAVRCIFNDM